ncbi:hypothetical protein D3C81_1541120 [compost metagenome]
MRRVDLPTCATGGDDADLAPLAPANQCSLGHHTVDAVDDEVELLGDVLGHGIAGNEVSYRMHRASRVDRPQALGHDLDLGPTHLPFQGMGLTIGIADADIVQVEQGNLAHATARQRLGRPRAHPADTDDRYMGLFQPLQAIVAIQPGNAGKAWIFCAHLATPKLIPQKSARIICQRRQWPPSLGKCRPILL